ncbi:MAG: lipoate--protein ligase family protein, partial [Cyanobacteria bacterium P01_H01_bin.130]
MEQMARDRWLWEEHAAGRFPSVLRFYGWREPTISLGYHQKSWPDHWNGLIWRGRRVPLVRRPTGGRAVLHQGGLTYAVVTSTMGTNRAIAYETLCRWLIDGFSSLGISL